MASHIRRLKQAYKTGDLTLYLGAGVSKGSGLPNWEELVQAIYFNTLRSETFTRYLKPYPNYLFAISEWLIRQNKEPLDIIIRRLKSYYTEREFVAQVQKNLYAGFPFNSSDSERAFKTAILRNRNLSEILQCCNGSVPGKTGLRSIVSYNYDNLLETGIAQFRGAKERFQVISKKEEKLKPGKIPIYHVHGYLPRQRRALTDSQIVLSEEHYNSVFQDAFYWGNVVQINQLTNSVGLMIGLSLSDRNIRRILDVIKHQPVNSENYIILKEPEFTNLNRETLQTIRRSADLYLSKFRDGRMKRANSELSQVNQILREIFYFEQNDFIKSLQDFGLHVITVKNYDDIAGIISSVRSA